MSQVRVLPGSSLQTPARYAPVKRLVPTPRGTAELDLAGAERHVFVNVTLFDLHGWATDDDIWGSHPREGLAQHLVDFTSMAPVDADAVVSDSMDTWRRRCGPAEGEAMTHRFAYGWLSTMATVAGVTGLVGWFVGRNAAKIG